MLFVFSAEGMAVAQMLTVPETEALVRASYFEGMPEEQAARIGPPSAEWIDPASPSTANLLGSLGWTRPDLFTGLAYDSLRDKLFAATPFGPNGLFEIDLSSCPPSPCNSFQIAGSGLFRDDASLGFSPATGMLYLVGTLDFGIEQPTFYNVIDPTTGLSAETLSLDVFTPAGLAAVPEPGVGMGVAVGVLGLLVANRQRDGELVPGRVKRRLRPHH